MTFNILSEVDLGLGLVDLDVREGRDVHDVGVSLRNLLAVQGPLADNYTDLWGVASLRHKLLSCLLDVPRAATRRAEKVSVLFRGRFILIETHIGRKYAITWAQKVAIVSVEVQEV